MTGFAAAEVSATSKIPRVDSTKCTSCHDVQNLELNVSFQANESIMEEMIDFPFYDMQAIKKQYAAEFEKQLVTYRTPFTIVLISLYTFAFVVGLIGNSMVIMVMVKHRHMRTVTNMFLVNLSVGDLLVVIVCMPFSLAPYVYKVRRYNML